MKAVWEAQKEALRSHCESNSPENKVCCPDDPKKRRLGVGLVGSGENELKKKQWRME